MSLSDAVAEMPKLLKLLATLSRPLCLLYLMTGQSAQPAERPSVYHPPRTPDGHVDFEGTWKISNLTPLERPTEFTQLEITAADAARVREQLLGLRANQPEDPGRDGERTLEPIRGKLRSSLIVDPADGRIPWQDAYQGIAAKVRRAALSALDNPEQRPALERCLSSGAAPPMQPSADINMYRIVQTPETVVILAELIHDARLIRMNSTHTPALFTSWLGDSIGWWEGDTLVIETKHFSANSAIRMSIRYLFLVSPQSIVIERFTRVSSDEINYVFIVTDTGLYARPWKGETHLLRSSARLFEYACHEGNYGMRNILEGARQREAGAASSSILKTTAAQAADRLRNGTRTNNARRPPAL